MEPVVPRTGRQHLAGGDRGQQILGGSPVRMASRVASSTTIGTPEQGRRTSDRGEVGVSPADLLDHPVVAAVDQDSLHEVSDLARQGRSARLRALGAKFAGRGASSSVEAGCSIAMSTSVLASRRPVGARWPRHWRKPDSVTADAMRPTVPRRDPARPPRPGRAAGGRRRVYLDRRRPRRERSAAGGRRRSPPGCPRAPLDGGPRLNAQAVILLESSTKFSEPRVFASLDKLTKGGFFSPSSTSTAAI